MRRLHLFLVFPILILIGMLFKGSFVYPENPPKSLVYLNHFFLELDPETYEAIVESDFIKNEFTHFETRTTHVENNESYTGAYIYGKNTYFEFFDESKSQDFMPEGLTSGMAFGVEKKGELKIIQQKLKDYKNGVFALRSREWNGVQIPWFSMTFVFYGNESPDIMTWVMEYHEDFLKKWHPDLVPISPGIMRKDILKRYAANIAQPELPKDKIFKDVIQVNLRLNPEDLEVIKGELAVYDFAISRQGNKEICTGSDVKIIIDTINTGVGKITGIKMSCHSSQPKEKTLRFGEKSRLTLHTDNTATWIF